MKFIMEIVQNQQYSKATNIFINEIYAIKFKLKQFSVEFCGTGCDEVRFPVDGGWDSRDVLHGWNV